MKKTELMVLSELMKNAKQSDRDLAIKIRVSQPTVIRTRRKLEKEGYIREYTALPEWSKLGYEFLVVTFASPHKPSEYQKLIQTEEFRKKVTTFFSDFPNIIFGTYGTGLGMSRMIISLHKSYSDYARLNTEMKRRFGIAVKIDSFIVSLQEDPILVPLSFKQIAESIKSNKK